MSIYVDALVDPKRTNLWSPRGTSASISYSFLPALPTNYVPGAPGISPDFFKAFLTKFSTFGSAQAAAVNQIAAVVGTYAQISLTLGDTDGQSGIRFGFTDQPTTGENRSGGFTADLKLVNGLRYQDVWNRERFRRRA